MVSMRYVYTSDNEMVADYFKLQDKLTRRQEELEALKQEYEQVSKHTRVAYNDQGAYVQGFDAWQICCYVDQLEVVASSIRETQERLDQFNVWLCEYPTDLVDELSGYYESGLNVEEIGGQLVDELADKIKRYEKKRRQLELGIVLER